MGTSSDTLSHLFNQGVNSVQLLRSESTSVDKAIALIEERADESDRVTLVAALNEGRYRVTYVMLTHKRTADKKSDNLPLFSRISLRSQIRILRTMRVEVNYQFVLDRTDKAGVRKARKRSPGAEAR